MEILAIIPARGGSKGIPKKNIVPIAGKPLIHFNVKAALNSKYISRLVVSTDDDEISVAARQEGAEVVKRPGKISGDFDSSESALLHTLEFLRNSEKYHPDILVFLQCTSPLTTAVDIDNAISKLIEENADTALTVASFHYYLWKENESGDVEGINHNKFKRPMRQQRDQQYIETGAVYVMRVNKFIEEKYRFFGKIVMSIMPEERCFEIDEPVDLVIAEQLIRHQQSK